MKKIAVAGLLTAMMSAASAQVYVGGGLGRGHLNVDVTCPATVKCEDTDTGSKLYVGYRITPVLALEGTYFNFGTATVKGPGGNASLKATAIGVGMAGRMAFSDRLALVGRLGLATVEAKGSVDTTTLVGSDSTSTPQVYVGIATEFSMTKSLKVFAAADFSRFEIDDDSGAVSLLNVGLQYDF
jgi:OmpA-OmpF porin, OOP family